MIENGRLVVTCFQDTFEALMTVCIILYLVLYPEETDCRGLQLHPLLQHLHSSAPWAGVGHSMEQLLWHVMTRSKKTKQGAVEKWNQTTLCWKHSCCEQYQQMSFKAFALGGFSAFCLVSALIGKSFCFPGAWANYLVEASWAREDIMSIRMNPDESRNAEPNVLLWLC